MAVRVLTKEEAIAMTEAQIFETLIEDTIPTLTKVLKESPAASVDLENVKVFIGVAADFAKGMAQDLSVAMERARRVKPVIAPKS
jgi:hypothetical protein